MMVSSWYQRWQRLYRALTCFWGEVFRKCFSRIDMMFFVLCFPCFWIFRWHQRPLSFSCCFLTGGRGKIRKDRADLTFAIWSYSLRSVWLDFHEWVATHLYIIIPFASPSVAQRLLRWLQVCAGPVPLTDPRWESDFWCPPCLCGGAGAAWLPAQAWYSLGVCSVELYALVKELTCVLSRRKLVIAESDQKIKSSKVWFTSVEW